MADYSKQLASDLYNSGCIKFEIITLKCGMQSPVYIDLRTLSTRPTIVKNIGELFSKHLTNELNYDLICGVPYTAIPFATALSFINNISMVMKRYEAKTHGTKNMIQGIYKPGQRALIVEDVISSGTSILQTVIAFEEVGLVVKDVIVILDREQGGVQALEKMGIRVQSLIKISKLFKILVENNQLNNEKSVEIMNWIQSTEMKVPESVVKQYRKLNHKERSKVLSYQERAKITKHKVAKQLFELMAQKKSNLCVAIDEHNTETILEIADKVGPNVVVIKLHCDMIDDFNLNFVSKLKTLATRHQFLVFEDRKFADIGNTVKGQFMHGVYKIVEWADLINCHVISGEAVIESLETSINDRKIGCLIVAQLSNKGNLITESYTSEALKFAENHQNFVIGFISQSRLVENSGFIHFTPGINLERSQDRLDQQYVTPRQAIKERGADVIIVGRGITKSDNPANTSKMYQKEGYSVYKELINE